MKILAIDTAFAACNVAVVDTAAGTSTAQTIPMARGQSEHLMPLIQDMMKGARMTYADLGLVAVTIGPGSFTGVRVGISAAKGIALAKNIPVQGVCTLDALYATWAAQGGAGAVTAMVDSRRDDIFVAPYTGANDLPISEKKISIMTPDQALARFAGVPCIGDGVALMEGRPADRDILLPDPVILANVGARLYTDGPVEGRGQASPLYMREADVTTPKKMV